jgi:hypothetical protein
MPTPRGQKLQRLDRILQVCRKNQWTPDTENLAGKIEAMIAGMMLDPRTKRTYVENIVSLLRLEQNGQKPDPA